MVAALPVILQLLVVLAGVITLAILLHRRLPEQWRTWGFGALTFILSQVARLPLLSAATALISVVLTPAHPAFVLTVAGIQLATSGLFEEGARYIVMRWLARHVRTWRSGVMFGAGHGGIEAILVFTLSAISTVVLLTSGDAIIQQTQAAAPQQAQAVIAQIQALRAGSPWWLYAAGVFERVPAIALHILWSVWVMRAVRGDGIQWLLGAMLMHIAVNTISVLVLQRFGVIATEAAVGVFGLLAVYLTLSQRRRNPAPVSANPPEPA